MDTTNALVSRKLSNGKILVIVAIGDEIVTTLDGVRSEPHCGGYYTTARPSKLPAPMAMPSGLATHYIGSATGPKIGLLQAEAVKILAVIAPRPQVERNAPCRRCGTHCYGDCTAN